MKLLERLSSGKREQAHELEAAAVMAAEEARDGTLGSEEGFK
jgi:hypothetical protein